MKILVINPGSTSSKIALYEDENLLFVENVEHSIDSLANFEGILDQFEFRKKVVLDVLAGNSYDLKDLTAVIGRGGMVPNLKSGGYLVDKALSDILKSEKTQAHISNLGGLIAKSIADPLGIPAFIYDAVTSGELTDVAKITGIPEITRQSHCHALNSRATAIKYASALGKQYSEMRIIVVHLGSGISMSAHKDGKIIDSVADDDGQFSPERSGSVPLLDAIDLCYSGKYTKEQLVKKVRGKGGMVAHLGTGDCRVIEKMINDGNEKAKLIFKAQAYQIAKGIGLLSPVLKGKIDVIILTGGLAYSKMLTDMIVDYVGFLGHVEIMPGENEKEALALGALRMLRGEEIAKNYNMRLEK